MSDLDHRDVAEALHAAERVLLASHIRPDGDAVGSLLGLGLSLEEAGKTVQMVLSDGVPSSLRYQPGSDRIVRKSSGEFDLTVVLDCSDMERVGSALNGATPDINIDHHITNLYFARLNLVEPNAVATSAILGACLPAWGFTITPDVASALLSGLISDTLGFRTSNMNPRALRMAAELMETGANLPELYSLALVRRSFSAAHYWGPGLSRLQRTGKLVWTSLTLEDRIAVGYTGNDDADLINILASIDEAEVAVIFVEQKGGKVKVSWRGDPGYDVSQIALQFGGGGHAAASGAEIQGALDEVRERVLQATTGQLALT